MDIVLFLSDAGSLGQPGAAMGKNGYKKGGGAPLRPERPMVFSGSACLLGRVEARGRFSEVNHDVLLLGAGPIGLMAMQMAKKSGARHIYVAQHSGSKARVDLACKFGADDVIFTDKENLEKYPFPRGGVDKVLVTSPPSTIDLATRVTNREAKLHFLESDMATGQRQRLIQILYISEKFPLSDPMRSRHCISQDVSIFWKQVWSM